LAEEERNPPAIREVYKLILVWGDTDLPVWGASGFKATESVQFQVPPLIPPKQNVLLHGVSGWLII
jgi:hypothetical protein